MALLVSLGGCGGASDQELPAGSDAAGTGTSQPTAAATGSSDIPAGTSGPPAGTTGSSETSITPCDVAGYSEVPRSEQAMPAEAALLQEVRVGRHDCFERTVLEFAGSALPQYQVEVSSPPFVGPSGQAVEVRGKSFLRVRLGTANAHTESGTATVGRDPLLPNGFAALEQVQLIEDFEAVVVMIIGLDQPRPFRVFTATRPTRLVIDVFTG